ncbi:MAG: tRNA (adenosine(37)-N6)-threonylcarbamoyltransferase complex transferase subunit TsaD [Synergistaceae bacterium]|nr:tRNA (adenosine(37)-N6)-threonylcarbamoyltransferase complex transferase subunit TsaD [Synergistaceae bacterium]
MESDRDFITLGIETSCDDTAIALLRGGNEALYDLTSSQTEAHSPFGGVLPELASRKHQEAIIPLIRGALSGARLSPRDVSLIAVTAGPGLMGSLLVGVMTAKALSQGWDVPLIGVNHLEGHIFANILAHPDLKPPFLCLVVSGGHTEMVSASGGRDYALLGSTRDDAAGEAYDKAAKLLGLGYPGGPAIERCAAGGDAGAFAFPVGMKGTKDVEFSFSGVKTSLRTLLERMRANGDEIPAPDICASFQRAVTEALLSKVKLAVRKTGVRKIALSGGVAANTALRGCLTEMGKANGWEVFLPPQRYCTDNALMIAAAGYAAYAAGERSDLSLTPDPDWSAWREKI